MNLLTAAALAAGVLLAALPAAAQTIAPCQAVNEPGMKVLVDDIVATNPALAALANTLAAEIDKNLEQLRLEALLTVKVRACQSRRPTGPADFLKPIVQQLLSREVVLEVWGSAVTLTGAGGPYNQTEIGYVLVPVRYYEFGATQPPGAFVVTVQSKPVQSVDDLVKLLNQSGRLGAYAALASGTVLLKSTPLKSARWDPARRQLCRASSMLASIKTPQSADKQLAAYSRKLAAEALGEAQKDTAYQGGLKLLKAGAECPR